MKTGVVVPHVACRDGSISQPKLALTGTSISLTSERWDEEISAATVTKNAIIARHIMFVWIVGKMYSFLKTTVLVFKINNQSISDSK